VSIGIAFLLLPRLIKRGSASPRSRGRERVPAGVPASRTRSTAFPYNPGFGRVAAIAVVALEAAAPSTRHRARAIPLPSVELKRRGALASAISDQGGWSQVGGMPVVVCAVEGSSPSAHSLLRRRGGHSDDWPWRVGLHFRQAKPVTPPLTPDAALFRNDDRADGIVMSFSLWDHGAQARVKWSSYYAPWRCRTAGTSTVDSARSAGGPEGGPDPPRGRAGGAPHGRGRQPSSLANP
jgi:hypothetical protein